MNQEKIASEVWSQDRHYRATLVQSATSGGCRGPTSSFVVVEHQSFFLKTGEFTPFCLNGMPDHITLHWNDVSTLAIECRGCEANYSYADRNWGKLRFAYDLNGP